MASEPVAPNPLSEIEDCDFGRQLREAKAAPPSEPKRERVTHEEAREAASCITAPDSIAYRRLLGAYVAQQAEIERRVRELGGALYRRDVSGDPDVGEVLEKARAVAELLPED